MSGAKLPKTEPRSTASPSPDAVWKVASRLAVLALFTASFFPAPVAAAASSSPFVVHRVGTTYHAISQTTGKVYSGTLKFAVESAVNDLNQAGGGRVSFTAGVFDLGSDRFEPKDVEDIAFEGQGIDSTVLQNSSSASTDTEPFDMVRANRIVIRDMTVTAGGALRSTHGANGGLEHHTRLRHRRGPRRRDRSAGIQQQSNRGVQDHERRRPRDPDHQVLDAVGSAKQEVQRERRPWQRHRPGRAGRTERYQRRPERDRRQHHHEQLGRRPRAGWHPDHLLGLGDLRRQRGAEQSGHRHASREDSEIRTQHRQPKLPRHRRGEQRLQRQQGGPHQRLGHAVRIPRLSSRSRGWWRRRRRAREQNQTAWSRQVVQGAEDQKVQGHGSRHRVGPDRRGDRPPSEAEEGLQVVERQQVREWWLQQETLQGDNRPQLVEVPVVQEAEAQRQGENPLLHAVRESYGRGGERRIP